MQDASIRIGQFADRTLGPACGISFSDGQSVAVLRQAHIDGQGVGQWLNVLRYHVSAPPQPPKPSNTTGFVARAEAFFWSVMQAQGEAQLAGSNAELAASEGVYRAVRDNVWQPTHKFLLRHKILNDAIGVTIDVIGVVAGVAFVIGFSPEIGALAVITGGSAAIGSLLLAGSDGLVFGFEVAGDRETSEKIEGSRVTQWARIVGTVMSLIDVPVGGMRALTEVSSLKIEAREALEAAAKSDEAAQAARARVAEIRNPEKHPGPVARRARKAKVFAKEAEKHRRSAEESSRRLHMTAGRDAGAAFVATPAGAALLTAAPPIMVLNQTQRSADKSYLKSLEPAGGMPADMRLEIRVSKIQKSPE